MENENGLAESERSVVPVKKHSSFIQTIPFSLVCTIIEVHLASFPQCAASLLSSCRDLWKSPSRLTINLHALIMPDLSLWPVFSNSVRYHIKGVNLVYKSRKTSLPPELSSRCAFLHTLDLRGWSRLENVSRCILRQGDMLTGVSLLKF